jgi:hypothetical protein
MIIFAINPAEAFGQRSGFLVKGDQVSAAEQQQRLERGWLGKRKQCHADEPPAQTQPDHERRKSALRACKAEFGIVGQELLALNKMLFRWWAFR